MALEILEILEKLSNTRSTNDKQRILENEKENETLKQVFFLAYSPYVNFFIRKIPEIEKNENTITLDNAIEKLQNVYERKITGNIARHDYIKELLENLSEENAEVIKRVILKNLKCGCSAKTYNKINNVIPIFPRYLAKNYDDKNKKKLIPPYFVQLKSDGARCCALITDNNVEYYTREGNQYMIDVPKIDNELIKVRDSLGYDVMIDGEMVMVDEDGVCNRQQSNGIVNKAIRNTISTKEMNSLRFYVWDCVSMSSFVSNIEKIPYYERFSRLSPINNNCIKKGDSIQISPSQVVDTLEEAEKISEQYIKDGEEGSLVKSNNGFWENKRSNHMLKIKDDLECDLIVVGWKPKNDTKVMNKGIGSLICETSDGKLRVSISSGLSYSQCGYNKIYNENMEDFEYVYDESFDLDQYTGKIVPVTYNSIISRKNDDKFSLFLPRIDIDKIRDDKFEADSFDLLK